MRFSLAHLMVAVLFAAIDSVLWRHTDPYPDMGAVVLVPALQLAALLSFPDRTRRRPFWMGFLVGGSFELLLYSGVRGPFHRPLFKGASALHAALKARSIDPDHLFSSDLEAHWDQRILGAICIGLPLLFLPTIAGLTGRFAMRTVGRPLLETIGRPLLQRYLAARRLRMAVRLAAVLGALALTFWPLNYIYHRSRSRTRDHADIEAYCRERLENARAKLSPSVEEWAALSDYHASLKRHYERAQYRPWLYLASVPPRPASISRSFRRSPAPRSQLPLPALAKRPAPDYDSQRTP